MMAKTPGHSCERVLLSDHHKKRVLSDEAAMKFDLDELVVISGVDSSMNACLLAET